MSNSEQGKSSIVVYIIVLLVLSVIGIYLFNKDVPDKLDEPVTTDVVVPEIIEEKPEIAIVEPIDTILPEEETLEEKQEELETEKPIPEVVLPLLNESDDWFTDKFSDLTWRKELLELIITEDVIRRLVVFADNFSRGILAYEHLPVVQPKVKFSAIEGKSAQGISWQWNEKNSQRFKLYIDLLRTIDKELLVNWYVELKPLVYQAYEELGYEGEDFDDILQICISKVLDMEIPKNLPELTRPSVMFKYKDNELESLDDAEKLMLRLGKENLLILKSVMLEINEKLVRVR